MLNNFIVPQEISAQKKKKKSLEKAFKYLESSQTYSADNKVSKILIFT